ncbi:secreted RxLR effector protein 161-like [Glycine max]|uniref:secreted RxLR effector protein 161-like n=1 Tax=Glycine max TaxID=3847 RepID=UPI001B354ACD|nr:secreted RxLR effector protein 161-like [Glycine max]
MLNCNPSSTPAEPGLKLEKDPEEELVDATEFRQLVGSLRYLCNSIPDICFAVSLISRFMQKPRLSHMQAAKRILRFVKGTIDNGVLFPFEVESYESDLFGYTNSDWKRDPEQKKSTGGYLFMYYDAPVAWSSRKQDVVALSTSEAEYVAASLGACQAVWMMNLLEELKLRERKPVCLLIDNKSTINLAKHPTLHG